MMNQKKKEKEKKKKKKKEFGQLLFTRWGALINTNYLKTNSGFPKDRLIIARRNTGDNPIQTPVAVKDSFLKMSINYIYKYVCPYMAT